ncbi:MAG: hypothetical protein GEV03_08645 [Streptosporangiales bacterium]|nr:hypothetical protein [Streptosporangiales bacterium]
MADPTEATEATRRLRDELAALGITWAGLSFEAAGMAALSVTYNLVVWCANNVFFWRAGHDFADFDVHPATDPTGAARRIKERRDELRQRHDLYQG